MELNSCIQQSNYGIMDDNDHHDHEEEEEDVNGSLSSFSEEEEEEEEDDEDGSLCSVSEEEFMEDVNSSSSSSSSLGSSSSSNGPLFEMSSLISQLPFKRGLSKHFEGKSQSFTSLSSVRSLEDLIKPERPLIKKKLKPSKSYGWGLDKSLLSTKTSSKAITKKSSTRGSFSSIKSIRRHSFTGSRPSFPPQGFGGSGLWTIG